MGQMSNIGHMTCQFCGLSCHLGAQDGFEVQCKARFWEEKGRKFKVKLTLLRRWNDKTSTNRTKPFIHTYTIPSRERATTNICTGTGALHWFFVSYWSNKILISQRGWKWGGTNTVQPETLVCSDNTAHNIQDQTNVTKAQPKTFVKANNCSWEAKYCTVLQSRTPVWLGSLVA